MCILLNDFINIPTNYDFYQSEMAMCENNNSKIRGKYNNKSYTTCLKTDILCKLK